MRVRGECRQIDCAVAGGADAHDRMFGDEHTVVALFEALMPREGLALGVHVLGVVGIADRQRPVVVTGTARPGDS